MQDKQIDQLADEAYQEAKEGNVNFWTMSDDDPEVKYWKEVWIKGYNAAKISGQDTQEKPDNGWISVDDRLPEIVEDGASELVLCVGHKGTHPEWKEYEIMRWTKLNKPDIKDHRGNWIEYGWSNRWWDTNPDLYNISHWMPLPESPNS